MSASEDCYILPEPSTSSISGVKLEFPGGTLTLHYDYDREGIAYTSGLTFKKVRAHTHTAESHCPASKIAVSYDKLIKISNSELVKELLNCTPSDQRNSWVLNHYMIYFDSDGCYEVLAESWESLPEKRGHI